MSFALCPSCGDEIKIRGQARIGQQISCPYCNTELEVVDLDPVELDWGDFVVESWDEDEDWDEEE